MLVKYTSAHKARVDFGYRSLRRRLARNYTIPHGQNAKTDQEDGNFQFINEVSKPEFGAQHGAGAIDSVRVEAQLLTKEQDR
jgi:hypothetical protein